MKSIAVILTLAAAGAAIHAADVNALWEQHCGSCHGKDGGGKTKMG